MDAAVISALAAVMGSIAGSSASIVTTWIAQRNQTVRDRAKREVYKRELLYSEFVTEVARLSADAVDHSLERPETLANVFALLGRIRFISSALVVEAAEQATRHIVDLYNAPNASSADQIYRMICDTSPDLLKTFSEACRVELSRYSAR